MKKNQIINNNKRNNNKWKKNGSNIYNMKKILKVSLRFSIYFSPQAKQSLNDLEEK